MGVDEAGEAGELEELTADEMAAFEERLLQEQLENALASGPLLERQESFTDEAWLREAQEHDDLVGVAAGFIFCWPVGFPLICAALLVASRHKRTAPTSFCTGMRTSAPRPSRPQLRSSTRGMWSR